MATRAAKKKKTRDQPNLTECQCCHLRLDLAKSSKLQILYSEWRVVLLCTKCLRRVESAALCSYCFSSTAAADDDSCFSCRQCKRRVHRTCDSEHRGSASASAVCGDCWVPETLARWRRCQNSIVNFKGGEADLGIDKSWVARVLKGETFKDSKLSAVCDSSTNVVVDDGLEKEGRLVVQEIGDDDGLGLKEGQGSCSNGVVEEASPQQECIFKNPNHCYFKYSRRRRGDRPVLTYQRRRVSNVSYVDGCGSSLSSVGNGKKAVDHVMFTYKRRKGNVGGYGSGLDSSVGLPVVRYGDNGKRGVDRTVFVYKRRDSDYKKFMFTYKRRSSGNDNGFLLTYQRRSGVDNRFMFTYKRRSNTGDHSVVTYKRRWIPEACSMIALEGQS